MKRPAWAETRSFAAAYAVAERRLPGSIPAFANARPIVFEQGQLDALPTIPVTDRQLPLPFDTVYLDVGRSLAAPSLSLRVRGFLVDRGQWQRLDGQISDAIAAFGTSPATPNLGLLALGGIESDGVFGLDPAIPIASYPGHPDPVSPETAQRIQCRVLERAVAALDFLASYNVELVEVPLSPRQRNRQIEKGRRVALTVQVKTAKRRASRPPVGKANFSHRFEVAGHYIHHFEEKPDGSPNAVFQRYAAKRPDKVIDLEGQPCVRFWQPPHVKGPINLPLVPKVRVVA